MRVSVQVVRWDGTPSFRWRSLSRLSPSGQVARRLIKQLVEGGVERLVGGGVEQRVRERREG